MKLSLLLVFILLLFLQFKDLPKTTLTLEKINPYIGFCVVLFIPLNWYCEYKKWQISVAYVSETESVKKIQHSFLAGIITGMLSPNMLGNFVGRIFYFHRSFRMDLIILTTLSNFSQFIWSMVFGLLGIAVISYNEYTLVFWIGAFLIILLLSFYFLFENYMLRLPFLKKWIRRFSSFQFNYRIKNSFLLWSGLRHVIFSLQFLFMLHFFNVELNFALVFWIWQVYFWVTLSPSLFLGKIVIRESIAIWVLSSAGVEAGPVILASLSIWILNLFIPTIFSLLLCQSPSDIET
jgi:hypothetical protein